MMKKQDTLGQFTKEMSILVTKELQSIANEVEIRVKPLVRDELEKTHRANIYDSYVPAINGTYHHTGKLASSIKGRIDGNAVKIIIEDKKFPNDIRSSNAATSTTEVYEILKNGSTANPRANVYPYEGKKPKNGGIGPVQWSSYIQQTPHKFEQRTLEDMEIYLDQLATNLKNHPEWYIKYKSKRIKN